MLSSGLHRLRAARREGVPTPELNRFAAATALAGAADALVAVSLAGSLFFNISPEASQRQLLVYLLVNMAPFAVLAPLIGPAIDTLQRGHRWIATALFVLRAVCAIALAFTLLDLAFYFFALALLTFAKASGVTRQALVPGLVRRPEHLVSANSRLARINIIAGAVGGAIGGAVMVLGSASMTLGLASAAFVAAAAVTSRMPEPHRVPLAAPSIEYEELHAPPIVATSWAFTLVRGSVGFFVFGLAFALRRQSEPAWMYAAAVAAYGVGSFAGHALAPLLRRSHREVSLVAGSLAALAVVAGFGALGPSRPLVLLVAVVLGGVASVGRQGFDALVQSMAPLAVQGQAFARFETRFQLAWVIGAVAATAIGIPAQLSMAIVAAAFLPATVLYLRAIREAHIAHVEDPFDLRTTAGRRVERAAEWQRRGLVRVATVEAASAVELARACGVEVPADVLRRAAALRSRALAGDDLDTADLACLLDDAVAAVATLDDEGQYPASGSVDATTTGPGGADADETVVDGGPPDGADPSSLPAPSSASSVPGAVDVGGTSICSSTDDDVIDQPSPDSLKVTIRREN